jgi:HK97 family phage major capsid protein
MTNENTELTKSVETALAAFNEYKGMVEELKSSVASIKPKMDAFDEAKFNKIQEDIGKAIEESQKEKARARALDEQQKTMLDDQKALKGELEAVKTALNRAPAPGTSEEKTKELVAKRTKLFNEFARSKGKDDFDDFLTKKIEAEPELKALSVGVDSSGGYLVIPEFGGVITTKVFESSPIRQLASVTTIGTDSYEVVVDYDEAGVGWVSETGSRSTTTTPTIGKVSIPVHELYANPKATQKVLEDPSMDMESWLMGKVADGFARAEATAFVTGIGVGKPRGFLTYTAGSTLSSGQIEQVNSGSTTAFKYAGVVNLQNALKEEYQSNAVFITKRASNALLMQILDGEGRPIFNMMYDKNVGLRPTIMGKEVYFGNDMPTVESAALSLAYGDFKRAYQIVDRKGVTVLRDPFSDKPYVSFYTTKRVGGGVINFEAIKLQKMSV